MHSKTRDDTAAVEVWELISDVIMREMASQITGASCFTQPFAQTQIKENIKAPRHWPL